MFQITRKYVLATGIKIEISVANNVLLFKGRFSNPLTELLTYDLSLNCFSAVGTKTN